MDKLKPLCFLVHTMILLLLIRIGLGTDQESLIALKATISSDPYQILSTNWSNNASVCAWIGVTCNIHGRVTALNFSGFDYQGTLSPRLANLTFLTSLDLQSNNFTGTLPSWLGNLHQLEYISLYYNSFSGIIPPSFLGGRNNNSKLRTLSLGYNFLTGNIPEDIGNLEALDLKYNRITGPIPSAVFNLSGVRTIDLTGKGLSGELPMDMCDNIPRIRGLYLSANLFGGRIPFDIYKCDELVDLSLSFNHFNGGIPRSIGWLSNIERLFLGVNDFQAGGIPSDLRNLTRLRVLSIQGASLTGQIPSFIFNMSSLEVMDFTNNSLSGGLQDELRNCKLLSLVSLSNNKLTGHIPKHIGNLTELQHLYLANNNFTGNIPSSIGKAESLGFLSLARNEFQGSIPESLGDLSGLETLDLSFNNLSGSIPKSLEKLVYVSYFNVSYNRLEGEIPTGGNFGNFTVLSFVKNHGLCGAARLGVPPCGETRSKISAVKLVKYVLPPFTVLAIIVAITVYWLTRRRKTSNERPESETALLKTWIGSSYLELLRATNDFSESNILGRGGFGSVYVGTLYDGLTVAVKVFDLLSEKVTRSFDTEIQALSVIRHRNLIKIIGCCSNPDFKALVLEYMPNGSLEKWLYSDNCFLDLVQRLNIAIDVASALEYLHLGLEFPIVHCDLKPSNVLLDKDMTAHVGDFGIAKLFGQGELMAQTRTLSTIGYMSPEYGAQGIVSTSGDVYSFGIMLLEMCTRKKPTDEMFGEETSLKSWVKLSLRENTITEVVDPNLLGEDDMNFPAKEQCLSSVLNLAMECLKFSHFERIGINEIVGRLEKIRTVFLETGELAGTKV